MPLTIDVDPVAFHLGPVEIRWYGLAVLAAIVVSLRDPATCPNPPSRDRRPPS